MTYEKLKALQILIKRKKGISANRAKKELNITVSDETIRNYIKRLGFRKITTKYCQFVSIRNRIKRILFCNFCLISHDNFDLVIFLDECTVEMMREPKTFWYRDEPNKIRLVGKYQHEASVHILGAISRRGRSQLMIFNGKLDSEGFQNLCDQFLIPFIREKFPLTHRVQMDNAKPHVSIETKVYLYRNYIRYFQSPAQSPDLNPIELVWNDLKNYLANEIQPKTVQELLILFLVDDPFF